MYTFKMLGAIILLGLSTTLVSAFPFYGYGYGYRGGYYPQYYGYPFYFPGYYFRQPYSIYPAPSKLVYHGLLEGECTSDDGLFYVDRNSFAFCANGQKTVQPCAPGSANPPYESLRPGQYYNTLDFCSENLIAQGYDPYYRPDEEHLPVEYTESIEEHDGPTETLEEYVEDGTDDKQSFIEEVHSMDGNQIYSYAKGERPGYEFQTQTEEESD